MQNPSIPFNEKLVIFEYLVQQEDLPEETLDSVLEEENPSVLVSLIQNQNLIESVQNEFFENIQFMDALELEQYFRLLGEEIEEDIYLKIFNRIATLLSTFPDSTESNKKDLEDSANILFNLSFAILSNHSVLFNSKSLYSEQNIMFLWQNIKHFISKEKKIDFLNFYVTHWPSNFLRAFFEEILDDIISEELRLDVSYMCALTFLVLKNIIVSGKNELMITEATLENSFLFLNKIKKTPSNEISGFEYLQKLEKVQIIDPKENEELNLYSLSQLFSNSCMIKIIKKSKILSKRIVDIYVNHCIPLFSIDFIFFTNYKVISLILPEDIEKLNALSSKTHLNFVIKKHIESHFLKKRLKYQLRTIKKHELLLKASGQNLSEQERSLNTSNIIDNKTELELISFHFFSSLSTLVYNIKIKMKRNEPLPEIRENPAIKELEQSLVFSVDYLEGLSNSFLEENSASHSVEDTDNQQGISFEHVYFNSIENFSDALLFLIRFCPHLRPSLDKFRRIFNFFSEDVEFLIDN